MHLRLRYLSVSLTLWLVLPFSFKYTWIYPRAGFWTKFKLDWLIDSPLRHFNFNTIIMILSCFFTLWKLINTIQGKVTLILCYMVVLCTMLFVSVTWIWLMVRIWHWHYWYVAQALIYLPSPIPHPNHSNRKGSITYLSETTKIIVQDFIFKNGCLLLCDWFSRTIFTC